MASECCGPKDTTGSPAWFLHGQAQVFPTLFVRDNFDDLQITFDLAREGACAGAPRLRRNGAYTPLEERLARVTNSNMTDKFEAASRSLRGVGRDWDECNEFSDGEESRDTWKSPNHMEILNFGLAYTTSF